MTDNGDQLWRRLYRELFHQRKGSGIHTEDHTENRNQLMNLAPVLCR